MGKKVTYTCDICRDPKELNKLRGCNFSNLHEFKLDTPQSTEGVHICLDCLKILQREIPKAI